MEAMNIKFKSVLRIDRAGRIVIPIALRKMMGIAPNDILSVTMTEDGKAVLKKNQDCDE